MIHDDFLLTSEMAKKLYHSYAKKMPIIDFHNHLSAKDIFEDRNYENITDVWLSGDHYKWRAMRANGIEEKYITGDAGDEEKFFAWARTVPNLLGNPLYHWTHLELARFFGVNSLLSNQTKEGIWNETNKVIQSGKLSARSILKQQNVEFVGTTDDPTDDLYFHSKLKDEEYEVTVSPSFRPDQALAIDANSFKKWVAKLSEVTKRNIQDYQNFIDALYERIDFFDDLGCRSSDHGINEIFYQDASIDDVSRLFTERLKGESLSAEEVAQFKTYTLKCLGEKYHEKEWVMQLHIGPLRNNNTRMFDQLGPDSGFDQMGDAPVAKPLSRFLDSLDQKQHLPRTILYTLNPRDNVIMASMAGNFQDSNVPGKIQFGTAWWFNDHYDGIMDQMKTLASVGLLKHFVGMLTDSRSMLSFTRHELFRRILCELLGTWVEEGKVPNDVNLLAEYVEDICYYNAKRYFSL